LDCGCSWLDYPWVPQVYLGLFSSLGLQDLYTYPLCLPFGWITHLCPTPFTHTHALYAPHPLDLDPTYSYSCPGFGLPTRMVTGWIAVRLHTVTRFTLLWIWICTLDSPLITGWIAPPCPHICPTPCIWLVGCLGLPTHIPDLDSLYGYIG